MKKLLGKILLFVFGQKRIAWFCRNFLPDDHEVVKTILEVFHKANYKDFERLKSCEIKDSSGELVGLFKNRIRETNITVWIRLYRCPLQAEGMDEEYFLAMSCGDEQTFDGLLGGIYKSKNPFIGSEVAKALSDLVPPVESTKHLTRIMQKKF